MSEYEDEIEKKHNEAKKRKEVSIDGINKTNEGVQRSLDNMYSEFESVVKEGTSQLPFVDPEKTANRKQPRRSFEEEKKQSEPVDIDELISQLQQIDINLIGRRYRKSDGEIIYFVNQEESREYRELQDKKMNVIMMSMLENLMLKEKLQI